MLLLFTSSSAKSWKLARLTRSDDRISCRSRGDIRLHRSIVGFRQDLEQHWVAELDCGHCQHTRHEPPFFPRPWVITEEGRLEHIGQILNCVLCDCPIVQRFQIG
jgi:Protein of unknown function (DUF3565)